MRIVCILPSLPGYPQHPPRRKIMPDSTRFVEDFSVGAFIIYTRFAFSLSHSLSFSLLRFATHSLTHTHTHERTQERYSCCQLATLTHIPLARPLYYIFKAFNPILYIHTHRRPTSHYLPLNLQSCFLLYNMVYVTNTHEPRNFLPSSLLYYLYILILYCGTDTHTI